MHNWASTEHNPCRFFGSQRYSEGLDLDLDPRARLAYVGVVEQALAGEWLRSHLRALGVERLEYGGRRAKNTETTVRFKLGVVNQGGIRLPTRIEALLRDGAPREEAAREAADPSVAERYLSSADRPLEVWHYPRTTAVRQKLAALACRALPQARDVFDLWVLAGGESARLDLARLRCGLEGTDLAEAARRVWEIGYEQFRDQVVEFLGDEDRRALDAREEWERRQLFVAELIDALLSAGR